MGPNQFAPIGEGTICSNCTKTVGYHYQTAEGKLFCVVQPEPRKPMLSDMSDALIRELHRQGMVSMRSEFDGAVLRIEPLTFTETFGVTPVAGDPVCRDCGNVIDPDCCGCGESKEGHNDWNAGHSFVPMGCDCMRVKP